MNKGSVKAIVNNVADDPQRYIVARAVCGELWFWGSWDDKDAACRVAKQFDNGCVLEVENE